MKNSNINIFHLKSKFYMSKKKNNSLFKNGMILINKSKCFTEVLNNRVNNKIANFELKNINKIKKQKINTRLNFKLKNKEKELLHIWKHKRNTIIDSIINKPLPLIRSVKKTIKNTSYKKYYKSIKLDKYLTFK